MKRLFLSILAAMVLTAASGHNAEARYASIVVNETTGNVMYSRNADQQLYPASLTKIMTLYMLFEALDNGQLRMNTKMKVSKTAAGRSPSKLGLRAGSSITVRDAMMALVTKSANDAATVIAEHLAKTERAFAKKMTRKAHALGMSRTTFRNASGLPHSQQKSTARDMAKLAIAIRRDFPHYFHVFKAKNFTWKGRKFKNHNKLLSSFKGTDGIKTGYIRASGFNLVATVERRNVRLIGVVFGGRTGASRDKHMIHLLNKQFDRIPQYTATALPPKAAAGALKAVTPPPPKPTTLAAIRGDRSIQADQQETIALVQPAPPPGLRLKDPTPPQHQPIIGWDIQIGSYDRQARAHRAARDARAAAGAILAMRPAELHEVRFGGLTRWQVHFAGFNETIARQACLELFQNDMSCIAIPQTHPSG